jgi:Na+/proline symporter
MVSVVGGAKILEFLNITSYEYAVVLTSVVVVVYIIIAGFRVVMITDMIQAVIIFSFMILILFNLSIDTVIQSLKEIEMTEMPAALMVGFFIYGFFSLFSSPDRFPLIFASESCKDAKKGML